MSLLFAETLKWPFYFWHIQTKCPICNSNTCKWQNWLIYSYWLKKRNWDSHRMIDQFLLPAQPVLVDVPLWSWGLSPLSLTPLLPAGPGLNRKRSSAHTWHKHTCSLKQNPRQISILLSAVQEKIVNSHTRNRFIEEMFAAPFYRLHKLLLELLQHWLSALLII